MNSAIIKVAIVIVFARFTTACTSTEANPGNQGQTVSPETIEFTPQQANQPPVEPFLSQQTTRQNPNSQIKKDAANAASPEQIEAQQPIRALW
ncbi:MAG: hypothetical protein F6K36_26575 [Symploca sp. SIO3C6]|nr:hypothetical protein [Symploca sp. SIO3C6]